jgi:Fe-S oxidoreductase
MKCSMTGQEKGDYYIVLSASHISNSIRNGYLKFNCRIIHITEIIHTSAITENNI